MRTLGTRFCRDERGATAIEYGLICALIFVAIVTAVSAMASTSNGSLTRAMERVIEGLSRSTSG